MKELYTKRQRIVTIKRTLIVLTLIFFSLGRLPAQPLPDYYTRTAFLFAPASVFDDGLLGFANPANLALLGTPDLRFAFSNDGQDIVSLQNWGVYAAIPYVGVSVQRQKVAGVGVTDFRLAAAHGSRALAVGFAYGWSAGRNDASGREKLFSTGAVFRPSALLSLGITGNFSLQSSNREGVIALGWRPLGTPAFTLFADAALQKDIHVEDAPWSAGVVFQPLPGLNITGRYFKAEAFSIGVSFNFGHNSIAAQSHFDSDGERAFNSYVIRAGGEKASVVQQKLRRDHYYTRLALKGRVDYLRYKLLDAGTQRFMDILKNIKAAAADPRLSAVAVNLSAMRIRPEHAWELREALKRVQATGKKVLVFIDNPGMTGYHLASVADRIILDPQGSMLLQGYALSKTYFKGTLEKLGLAFEELRLFKYKSAAEMGSRDSMSDADREQLQAYVDDWYTLSRADICAARGLSPEAFDRLIDEKVHFNPQQALQSGLVDTLARWSSVDDIIAGLLNDRKKPLPAARLLANAVTSDTWGTQPKIAVVYALGVCAMDQGIKARWLERVFQGLAQNPAVKAVVLRVDSPGGDGMASDVVAEAIKKCRENKPVIISQGQVAASGGYWISMYGDAILAGPTTITGSIGVIFGWLYDKSLGQKLGMTWDLVKRGRHADLGLGIRLPFLNLRVPARNLNDIERQRAEAIISNGYEQFVGKVADGRGLSVERVKEIAQGRIYSGIDGKEIHLVDNIGGLLDAIDVAKSKAGLSERDEVEIVELPEHKGLIDLPGKISPFGLKVRQDPVIRFIEFMAKRNGEASAILLPGMYPEWQ